MSLERKSNTIELRAEETTGNHYMLVDKTENTDPFFDMDLANAGSYFVTECDLKVDQPGMVTALFRLRDLESNAWSMDVQVNENGSISSCLLYTSALAAPVLSNSTTASALPVCPILSTISSKSV